ncbi:unnamed protein product, partial [Rotaria sp. Silwood1]
MKFLQQLNINAINQGVSTGTQWIESKGTLIESYSPVDGKLIGNVVSADAASYQKVMTAATKAFEGWRMVPAPKRGEIVRQIGDALREQKEPLGQL